MTPQDFSLTYCQHMSESRTSSDGWHCLIVQEMLLLLLPLLNSSSVKKLLLPFSKDKSASSSGDEANCPICRSSLSIPFIALPCQHRYCYYCLRTRCAATSSYRCARCNEVVVAIQRQGSS